MYYMILLIGNAQNRQIQIQKVDVIRGRRQGGGWRMGETAEENRVSFWGDKHVLELIVVVLQLCKYTKNPESYTLRGWFPWYSNYTSIKLLFDKALWP